MSTINVDFISYQTPSDSITVDYYQSGLINFNQLICKITQDKSRNQLLLKMINNYFKKQPENTLMIIIGKFIEPLRELSKEIGGAQLIQLNHQSTEIKKCSRILLIGGFPHNPPSYFNDLNTLMKGGLWGNPPNQCLIIDWVDSHPICQKLWNHRLKYYSKKGWTVETLNPV